MRLNSSVSIRSSPILKLEYDGRSPKDLRLRDEVVAFPVLAVEIRRLSSYEPNEV